MSSDPTSEVKILDQGLNWCVVYKPAKTHSDEISPQVAKRLFKAVHRLDYETAGCLLMADENSWPQYRELFATNNVEKLYLTGSQTPLSPYIQLDQVLEGFIGGRYRGSKKTRFAWAREELKGFHGIQNIKHVIRATNINQRGLVVSIHTK